VLKTSICVLGYVRVTPQNDSTRAWKAFDLCCGFFQSTYGDVDGCGPCACRGQNWVGTRWNAQGSIRTFLCARWSDGSRCIRSGPAAPRGGPTRCCCAQSFIACLSRHGQPSLVASLRPGRPLIGASGSCLRKSFAGV